VLAGPGLASYRCTAGHVPPASRRREQCSAPGHPLWAGARPRPAGARRPRRWGQAEGAACTGGGSAGATAQRLTVAPPKLASTDALAVVLPASHICSALHCPPRSGFPDSPQFCSIAVFHVTSPPCSFACALCARHLHPVHMTADCRALTAQVFGGQTVYGLKLERHGQKKGSVPGMEKGNAGASKPGRRVAQMESARPAACLGFCKQKQEEQARAGRGAARNWK
jgi:hypothetical protein